MDNELLLLSNNDIPFAEAQLTIHQPTVKEIALIGEESFWSGAQFLNFSRKLISFEGSSDKIDLGDISDFEIFMSIMSSSEIAEYKNNAKMVLTLLFPTYQFKYTPNELLLANDKGMARINSENFEVFKDILKSMFDLEESGTSADYNPVGKRAERIAEKLRKAKERKNGGKLTKVAILSRYVSILSIGLSMDMNAFMNYTVFQLKDAFKRFQMKQSFDIYTQAKMAGATGLDEVDNWMDDIHS